MNPHDHCRNCILMQCTKTEGCPVVSCHLGCGMKLHECKTDDHGLLCQNQKVPCVNSYYGCPMFLLRSQLGLHIQNCPASAIQCTHEWGRNPLYSLERLKWVPFKQPNPTLVKGYLDVELALHDQKVVNQIVQGRYRQGVARKWSEQHNLSEKLSYERAKCFQEEIKKAKVVAHSLLMEEESSPSMVKDLKQWTFVDQVENKIESSSETTSNHPSNEIDGIPECPGLPDTQLGLGLNLNIEMIPKFGRHSYLYKIPCRQVLQRNEFPSHFKNVHAETHSGLGWIEQRCPLAQYGCSFVCYPLRPSTQEASIVFSQDLGVFGFKPLKTIDNEPEHCSILCLPSEVLEEICKWLDGFSLNNLMQTCQTMHYTLSNLVEKKGVVTVGWKRRVYEDGSASWTPAQKMWSFTKAFSDVQKWVWSDVSGLHAHFEKCPFFEKHITDKPFQYVPKI